MCVYVNIKNLLYGLFYGLNTGIAKFFYIASVC